MSKTNKLKIPFIILKLIFMTIYAVFFTITISLFNNLKLNYKKTLNPKFKDQINRELEANKMVKLLNDRLKTIERLIYGIIEDPEYLKSDKGKYDIKQIKKETK